MATEHFRPEPPSPAWTNASPKWPKPSRNITKPDSWGARSTVFRICSGRRLLLFVPALYHSQRHGAALTHVKSIQSSHRSAHPWDLSTMRSRSDAGDAETLADPNPSSHLRTHRLPLVVGPLPMLALCANSRSIALSPLSSQFFE